MDLSWRKQRLSITRNVKIARESSSQTTSLRRHIVSPGIKNVCCICSLTRSENLMAPYRNMTVSARSMLLNMLKYSDWPLRKPVRIYGRHWRVSRGRKWFLSPWRGCRRWKRLWIFSLVYQTCAQSIQRALQCTYQPISHSLLYRVTEPVYAVSA